jgi:hypothetical protein
MKPRRHDMLDFHPAAVVGSFLGGDPYEASPVDAEPDPVADRPKARLGLTARLRRRRERAATWARAQSGRLPVG